MEKAEKIVPGFTMIGLRYDNSSAVDCIPDEQLFDDLRILSPDHETSLRDMLQLKRIKEALPYRDGDFKIVEVLPYRDHDVDYSGVVFDLAWALAEGEVQKSPDGESVLMQMWDARAIAQTGVLFGIIPWEIQKIPGLQYAQDFQSGPQDNFEDDMQPYDFTEETGPVMHEPDLQVHEKNGHTDETVHQNGHKKITPSFVRQRINPRVDGQQI